MIDAKMTLEAQLNGIQKTVYCRAGEVKGRRLLITLTNNNAVVPLDGKAVTAYIQQGSNTPVLIDPVLVDIDTENDNVVLTLPTLTVNEYIVEMKLAEDVNGVADTLYTPCFRIISEASLGAIADETADIGVVVSHQLDIATGVAVLSGDLSSGAYIVVYDSSAVKKAPLNKVFSAGLTNYYTKAQVDSALAQKQGALTAGDNIDITNNVISATGAAMTIGEYDDGTITLDYTGAEILDEYIIHGMSMNIVCDSYLTVLSARGIMLENEDMGVELVMAWCLDENATGNEINGLRVIVAFDEATVLSTTEIQLFSPTIDSSASNNKIPTALAVKNYVDSVPSGYVEILDTETPTLTLNYTETELTTMFYAGTPMCFYGKPIVAIETYQGSGSSERHKFYYVGFNGHFYSIAPTAVDAKTAVRTDTKQMITQATANKLSGGDVVSGNGGFVTGGQVYTAIQGGASALTDDEMITLLSSISDILIDNGDYLGDTEALAF